MARLALTFLGSFQVALDGTPVTRFRSDKVRALLAYLAVEADRPHQRASLCGLLWPDQPDDGALHNLSQTLLRLREALGDTRGASFLRVSRQAIQWNSASDYRLDAADFVRLVTGTDIAALEQAAALYRGEFLPGFSLPGCSAFDEWLLLERTRFAHGAIRALDTIARAQLAAGHYPEAEQAARRQLALDPWREAAHALVMRALAHAGQRTAALVQYETCRRILKTELGVTPSAELTALYEQIRAPEWRMEHAALPMPSAGQGHGSVLHAPLASAHHNLPAQLTSFIGREKEVAAIRQALTSARLITLMGAGGCGKTRLALEAARAGLDAYADGVFFVALAPIAAAPALVSAIARELGAPLHGSDPTAALLSWVRDKQMLLILDNFEHLLEGVGLVVELLEAAPRVQIIVTSREGLNVRGEQVYSVEGLEYGRGATAAAAASSPAMRLFVQGAMRAHPDFRLREAELPALHRMCELVGGMPLALELAAAWVGILPPEEIAHEITRDVDFLEARWPDAPARHRSMRAVFDWSWRLLGDTERQALRQMSVFRGGFTRAAAETIAGATLRVLAGLQRKSLLHWRPANGAAGRYEIHELVRQFAAEQLAAVPDERAVVADRHGAYYLQFVAARGRRLGRAEPREAAAEIRTEIDNVRQAWSWGVDERRVAELAQAAYGWWQFCLLASQYFEGRRTFGLAVERLQTAPGASTGLAIEPPPRGLSTLLAIHANLLFTNAPYEQMAAQAREAIRLGAASGDVEGETLGTYVLGRALQELEQQRDAHALWERTIQLARAYQPGAPDSELLPEAEWMAHIWLFGSSLFFEDYAGGRRCVVESLRIAQSLGKRHAELFSLSSLAMIDFYLGDDLTAQRRYEQVISLARALDDRWAEMRVQCKLSEVLRLQGRYVHAQALLLAVVATAGEIGNLYEEILALAGLVRLHCQLGDIGAAGTWRDKLVDRMAGMGVSRDCEAEGLRACAVYRLCSGDEPQALADAEHALEIAERVDIPNFRADSAVILGHARAAMNAPDAAAAYDQAVSLYLKIGNTSLASEPQAGLAALALEQGDCVRAQTLVDALLPALAEHPRARVFTPFYAFAICYRVLAANADPRAASLLGTAQQRLRDAADQIPDPALRQSFLETPAHRELLGLVPTERAAGCV